MKLQAIKCQKCGASLEIEEDLKFYFCKYCGYKIMVDDGSKTITHRQINEARIREVEYK